jgi:GNAT superfamily N-acetyltransferase
MHPLPTLWTTDRLIIRNSGLEETSQLRDIFNANANVGQQGWDPTFTVIDEQEIERLVQQSDAREEPGHENFQMQTIYAQESGQIIGYFHCYHGLAQQPTWSFISMLVLHPSQQKHGYGREVMEGVLDQSKTLADRAALGARVYLKNWPALRFWIGLGFKQIDKMDGDKTHSDATQASLVLVCPLKTPDP